MLPGGVSCNSSSGFHNTWKWEGGLCHQNNEVHIQTVSLLPWSHYQELFGYGSILPLRKIILFPDMLSIIDVLVT